jgi:hypothetical protein
MNRSRRTVIEVRDDLHSEIRKLALLNDIRIYELANAVLEDFLKDNERANALIKRLRLQRSVTKLNVRQEKRKGR